MWTPAFLCDKIQIQRKCLFLDRTAGVMSMKKRKGFTMIELMVSIAIILILTSAMTVSVATYIQKTQDAKQKIQLHQDKFDIARAKVDGLLGGTTGGGATATPTPTSGGGGVATPTTAPTTAPATPTPTTAPATPTSTPTPTPTPAGTIKVGNYTVPAITGIPASFAGTKTETKGGWGEYEFNALFTIPKYTYVTYAAIYLPPGTISVIEWYSCTLEFFDPVKNIAVISIPANNTGPAIRVDYSGAQTNWANTRIFDIVQKT